MNVDTLIKENEALLPLGFRVMEKQEGLTWIEFNIKVSPLMTTASNAQPFYKHATTPINPAYYEAARLI